MGAYCFRILLSVAEQWDHEPEWLMNLRGRLTHSMMNRSSGFGLEI